MDLETYMSDAWTARRIPAKPTSVPAAPSLHTIVKSLPFSNGFVKQRPLDYPHQSEYPQLSVLSSSEIAQDLEYMQARRHTSYDNRDHRTAPMNANVAGPSSHPTNYDQPQYVDSYGRPAPPPPPQPSGPAYSHHPMSNGPLPNSGTYSYMSGPPPPPAPPNSRMHQHHASGPSSSSGGPPNHHLHPSHLNHDRERERMDRDRERAEREHDLAGPAMGGPSGNQIHPNHPYFGQGRGGGPANVYPSGHPHGQEQQAPASSMGGGRRSMSPGLPMAPNGEGTMKHGGPPPPPGTWMGPGMGMGTYVPSSKPPSDWVERERRMTHLEGPINDKDDSHKWHREREQRDMERDFYMEREREKQREREMRNRELKERDKRARDIEVEGRDMDRERERAEREKEQMDLEHERLRDRDLYMQQQQQFSQQQHHQHRPPTGPHTHSHSVPPGHHHHHRAPPHHHHVVHHHHPQGSSSHVSHPGGHSASSAPPGVPGHSPRVSRDYEGRHPADTGPPIGPKSMWKGDGVRSGSIDLREREKAREKEREPELGRKGPYPLEERDRPVPVPLSLGSSQLTSVTSSSLPNTTSLLNGTSSPRTQWKSVALTEDGYRPSSSGGPSAFAKPQDQQTRSPGHRYANPPGPGVGRGQPAASGPSPLQNSMAASPNRRPPPPQSPNSSSNYNNPPPAQISPPRCGPPPPPGMQQAARKGPGRIPTPTSGGPPPPAGQQQQQSQNGPGRPFGPPPPPPPPGSSGNSGSGSGSRRSPSPSRGPGLLPSMGSGSGSGREREQREQRDWPSTIPPSKMSLPQMVDGH